MARHPKARGWAALLVGAVLVAGCGEDGPRPEQDAAKPGPSGPTDPGGAARQGSEPLPGSMPVEIRHLVERLRSDDPATRRKAAEALGRIGAPAAKAMPYLEARLADPDPEVQVAAAEAMATIRGKAPAGQSIAAVALTLDDLRGTYRAGPPEKVDIVHFLTEVSGTPKRVTRADAEQYFRQALEGAVWTFRGEAVEVDLPDALPANAGLKRLQGTVRRVDDVLKAGWLKAEAGLAGRGSGTLGHQIQDVEFVDASDAGLTVRYTAIVWMPRNADKERIEIRGTATQRLAREGAAQ